jgi:hypothetical protein
MAWPSRFAAYQGNNYYFAVSDITAISARIPGAEIPSSFVIKIRVYFS